MAVIAIFPKPSDDEFFDDVSFCVYFLLRKIERTMPHIIQRLIRSAIVEKASGVISAADSVVIPTLSAAACAICVS